MLRLHGLGVVEPQRVLEKTVGWGNAWRHKQKLSDIWEGSSGFCVTVNLFPFSWWGGFAKLPQKF